MITVLHSMYTVFHSMSRVKLSTASYVWEGLYIFHITIERMHSFILPRIESKGWVHSPKYLILDKFLGYLEQKDFSGFSDLSSNVHTFVLLFLEGKALQGFRIIENRFYLFSSLYQRLPQLGLTQLAFYETPSSFITAITDVVFSIPQHKGLSTTFTSLRLLLKDLESDKFEGTVTIQWANTEGLIILHHGIPENAFLVTPSDISEGKGALEEILDKVDKEEGMINVYQRTEKVVSRERFQEQVPHLTATGIEEEIRTRYGQLGIEFLQAVSGERLLKDIASALCVDYSELEPLCTYLVEKGYVTLKKRDAIREKTRDFWNEL